MTLKKRRAAPAREVDHQGRLAIPIRPGLGAAGPGPREGTWNDHA